MSIELIKSLFTYTEETGEIKRIDGKPVKVKLKKASTSNRKDSSTIYINNTSIRAASIPFALVKGYIPKIARFIDGDQLNLKMSNLYDAETITREEISQDILKSIFDYDPETGVLTRKSNKSIVGCERKNESGKSYLKVVIFGYSFGVHRVAFLMTHGYMPEEVDHKDGNGLNNKINNIRPSNKNHNAKNHRLQSNNTSGIPGVIFEKDKKLWRVSIGNSGKVIRLGRTKDFFKACCMRKSAELKYGYSSGHGSKRPL